MNLQRQLAAREIVYKAGMIDRPEYYSGRGATLTDLTSNHLEKIYDLIKDNYNFDAAKNFVQMVSSIPVMSASDFLTTLYFLERNDWKYNETVKSDLIGGICVAKDKEGNYDMTHGMVSILEALTDRVDETEMIRGSFLNKHIDELPSDKRKEVKERKKYSLFF